MKDQLIAILEAMRLSQAALAKHSQPGGPNSEATLKQLRRLLDDQNVVQAMAALYPDVDSPNTSPDDLLQVNDSGEHPSMDRQPKRLLSGSPNSLPPQFNSLSEYATRHRGCIERHFTPPCAPAAAAGQNPSHPYKG